MKKLSLAFILVFWAGSACAQTCPTRPSGDSTNACASTAFVQSAVSGGGTVNAGNSQDLGYYVSSGTAISGTHSPAGAYTWGGKQTFTADVYFEGRPFVSGRAFGMVGDGSTDDFAAGNSAINACQTLSTASGVAGCGVVYLDAGHYCIKGGTLVVSTSIWVGTRLVGAGVFASAIDSCGTNTTPVTLNGRRAHVEHLGIDGPLFQGGSVSGYAVQINADCVECEVFDCFIIGGLYGIYNQATDFVVSDSFVSQVYADAIYQGGGVFSGGYYYRNKVDTNLPCGLCSVGSYGTTYTATTYNIKDVVVGTGAGAGFIWQNGGAFSNATVNAGGSGGTPGSCVITVNGGTPIQAATINATINSSHQLSSLSSFAFEGYYSALPGLTNAPVSGCGLTGATVNLTAKSGTSSGTFPSISTADYNINVDDGGAVWRLAANAGECGFRFDTGSVITFLDGNDTSGPYNGAICLNNSLSGTAPQSIYIAHNDFGSVQNGLLLQAGSVVVVTDSIFSSFQTATSQAAVNATGAGTWVGDLTITGSLMAGWNPAISIAHGSGGAFTGNSVFNTGGTAVSLLANAGYYNFTGNNFGTSANFGGPWTTCFTIASGSSQHYNTFQNNTCAGASVTNNGSGTGNNIQATGF